MKSKFQAVIFDLDGTLLDTFDDLADSMNSALSCLGFPTHPNNMYKYFVGDGVEMLARRVLPVGEQAEKTVSKCVEAMLSEYGKHWATKTKLYDGVSSLLDELVTDNIICAVLSNKPDHFTQKAVNRFLGEWPFAVVAGATANLPKKPDPAGALAIACELDTPPEKFIYIGDTNTDMETAIAANMYPAAALWGFRSGEELAKAGAKTLLTHPLDTMKLF